jgi:toxin ParE1/3/4
VRPVLWSETALSEYQNILQRVGADNPSAARRVADKIDRAIELLAHRNIGRRGRVEGTFEKSVVGLPYIVAFAIDTDTRGEERLVVLRIIHTSRNWPPGQWPRP